MVGGFDQTIETEREFLGGTGKFKGINGRWNLKSKKTSSG
jgi:hypothetical protein